MGCIGRQPEFLIQTDDMWRLGFWILLKRFKLCNKEILGNGYTLLLVYEIWKSGENKKTMFSLGLFEILKMCFASNHTAISEQIHRACL